MNEVTYPYIQDPGHGWIKVPMMDLMASGVIGKITEYSYHNSTHAFLEEDHDAGIFVEALKAQGKTVKFKSVVIDDFDTYLPRHGRFVRFTGK